MKQIKKMLAIVIAFVLSIAMIPSTNVDAAAKAKLNKKKATIYVGKTVQLKVKNNSKKVKWISSNKKVATVNVKGKVKGKKAGKATITAKVGNKKYKCQVTVKNVLKVNKTYVSMTSGESSNIIVTFKKSKEAKVWYDIKNEDIVSCEWGEFDNGVISLTITGNQVGKTVIIISNGYNNEKIRINVSIKQKKQIDIYNANFDDIVQDVKINGEFSSYGAYCTYGYVSVLMDGSEITFFEGHDRKGHSVTIKRGSYTAEAKVKLKVGYATAKFDIRYFKGDCSDSLNWNNNPSIENAFTYDAAVANVLKNVANYDFYINGHSFRDIGFTSYLY